jgi:hypothetical protein
LSLCARAPSLSFSVSELLAQRRWERDYSGSTVQRSDFDVFWSIVWSYYLKYGCTYPATVRAIYSRERERGKKRERERD